MPALSIYQCQCVSNVYKVHNIWTSTLSHLLISAEIVEHHQQGHGLRLPRLSGGHDAGSLVSRGRGRRHALVSRHVATYV